MSHSGFDWSVIVSGKSYTRSQGLVCLIINTIVVLISAFVIGGLPYFLSGEIGKFLLAVLFSFPISYGILRNIKVGVKNLLT